MFKTEDEILKAVNDKKKDFQSLRDRFEADYGKYRLTPYNRGKDYKSFTSNAPRTLADKIINIISQARQQIRIPIDKEHESGREKISNGERLLIGLLNISNSRLELMGQPSIVDQMSWHSVVRGWYALRAYITKLTDGSTFPRIDVWDMFHTYYDIDENGLLWICHTRPATASSIKAEYGIDIKKKSAVVYDFWDKENISIIIEKTFAKNPEEHELKRVPACVCMAGSAPFIASEKYDDTIKDAGESWLSSNRGLVDAINALYSDILTIVNRGAKVPLKAMSEGGKLTLDNSPWALEKGQASIIPLDSAKGEDILPLIQPTMPRDAAVIANIFSLLWQQGGLPTSAYGEIGFQLSGYAINQLSKTMGSVIGVGKGNVEKGGRWLMRELLLQFSEGGFKGTKVEGRDEKGKYFSTELKPEDINKDWYPEFNLIPDLPEDTMQKFAMARIAHEGENPLLSAQSTNDRILGIQDPDLEEEIKLEEWAMQLPTIRLRRIANALKKRGRDDLAEEVLNMLGQIQQEAAQPKSEAVQPEFQTGVPTTAMPAEELGRTPPTIPEGEG